MGKTQRELYEDMIKNIDILLSQKEFKKKQIQIEGSVRGLEYAALINEIGALVKAKTHFLLYK